MFKITTRLFAPAAQPGFLLVCASTAACYLAWQHYPNYRLEIGVLWAATVVSVVLWKLLLWLLDPEGFQERKDFLDLYAKILGGLALIMSLFFTWQGIKTTQDGLALSQHSSEQNLRVAVETLKSSRSSQVAERYSDAVGDLANEKMRVRIGAIYALERLAAESPDDHWQIMQVLAEFVREAAHEPSLRKQFQGRIAADIQAAMNVIGKRRKTYQNGEDVRLVLDGADLRGLKLTANENLEGLSLQGVDFRGAQLRNIRLKDSILFNADLRGAALAGSDLAGADLSGAKLHDADLRTARGLRQSQVGLAEADETTQLPDNLP